MIYEVGFSHGEQVVFVNSDEEYACRDEIILHTSKGKMLGKIKRVYDKANVETDGKILGPALESDYAHAQNVAADSSEALKKVKLLVKNEKLDMQIQTVAFTLDYAQLFISFTAEKRVDFRQLLYALSDTFHTRIELRQIGVRDVAKLYGGLGPCGRPLCCASFLYEFPVVSIKMAKNQQLGLNQSKLNGLCGRLMCCLSYEDTFYKEAAREFPDFGEFLETEEGRGRVIGMNILARTVKVRYEAFMREYKLEELEGVLHGRS